MGIDYVYREKSLCWQCENACNRGCSWSDNFTPVDGWTARPETNAGGVDSYLVIQCPEFVPEKREDRNPDDMDSEGCMLLIQRLLEVTRQDYIKGTNVTVAECERFIRGKGASRLHGIADPEGVIQMLQKARIEYKKKRAMQARIGG